MVKIPAMNRIAIGVLGFLAGVVVTTMAGWLRVPEAPPPEPTAPRAAAQPGRSFGAGAGTRDAVAPTGSNDQRVRDLEGQLAREKSDRQRIQGQLDEATRRLAQNTFEQERDQKVAQQRMAIEQAQRAQADAAVVAQQEAAAADAAAVDYSKSQMERALIAGGLDPNRAADIKRKSDELQMAEMYLRDQATREEWVDTPRFEEEMASLQQQQLSIRGELGDDGYDKYLFTMGQTNRVRVDDVMTDSPAAQAGVQTGDMILSYGNMRVFAPDELVAQTQQGDPGEMVNVTIIRQDKVMTVQVPRGPLGLRVAATQSMPRS